jgi:hypothetical protein
LCVRFGSSVIMVIEIDCRLDDDDDDEEKWRKMQMQDALDASLRNVQLDWIRISLQFCSFLFPPSFFYTTPYNTIQYNIQGWGRTTS